MKKTIPLIVGNWKMNPTSMADAVLLAGAIARRRKTLPEPYIAIAPPFVYLSEVAKKINKSSVALAAQDTHHEPLGPFTGEISVTQLKELGARYIIVGHSERRAMGETDEEVRRKTLAILKHQLTPIVCVGERKRDEHGDFFSFVEAQLRGLAEALSPALAKKVVIAYEPIWAIGTGKNATAENVKEMQLFIESVLTKLYDRSTAQKIRLLYGGSVNARNAAELHQHGDMQGFLVGGASLKAEEFLEIIKLIS